MLIKTHNLTKQALHWAVGKCEGYTATIKPTEVVYVHQSGEWHHNGNWRPSTNAAQGEPIIERERIQTAQGEQTGTWCANQLGSGHGWITGPTRLIAAMRCYVRSKLGDEVDVPDDVLALDA